jgi:hypothetical protein
MIATLPLKPELCNRQMLEVVLGAIEQHRRAGATLSARKSSTTQLSLALVGHRI